MNDNFDGVASLRTYDRTVFHPRECCWMGFEMFPSYTLSRMLFEGHDTYVFVVKGQLTVEGIPHGALSHMLSAGASLVLSAGGTSYIEDGVAVATAGDSIDRFIGLTADGEVRLVPKGAADALEQGLRYGVEASPFLVLHGKRLKVDAGARRSRDRLLFAQLRTGEPAFVFIKGVDVAVAADYAFQLGCMHAAVIANERRIDIYGRGFLQDRQSGCSAAFVVR